MVQKISFCFVFLSIGFASNGWAYVPKIGHSIDVLDKNGYILDCDFGLASQPLECFVDNGRYVFKVTIQREKISKVRRTAPSWSLLPQRVSRHGPAPAEKTYHNLPPLFSAIGPEDCEALYIRGFDPGKDWQRCKMRHIVYQGHIHVREDYLPISNQACGNAFRQLDREKGSWREAASDGSPAVTVERKHLKFPYLQSIIFSSTSCILIERSRLWMALTNRAKRSKERFMREIFRKQLKN